MTQYKIEKGVAIPQAESYHSTGKKPRSKEKIKILNTFLNMSVGDSTVIKFDKYNTAIARTKTCAKNASEEIPSFNILARRIKENKLRIWRVS